MLLQSKTALVYGAGGAIGSAVARAYAREGAAVHLLGRTRASLERTARQIAAEGGSPEVAILDVLDREAVEEQAREVAASSGIDICFNATANNDLQGIPLLDLDFAASDWARTITASEINFTVGAVID